MPVLLITAPYMLPTLDRFRPVFDHYGFTLLVPKVQERLSEGELLEFAGTFDATICGDDRYSARVLEACAPRLKVISKWGTGIDSINQAVAADLHIQVRRTVNAFTIPVSDSVLAYILAFARRQPWMDQSMKSGEWKKIQGHALHEAVLGVIGVGNIGKSVLRKAAAFGMTLLGNDIVEIDPDFLREVGVEMTSLANLLERSDYVSMNTDLNPSSYHLMNASRFAQMKPNAVIINTSRGPVIEEAALVDALQSGRIAGAGLDVFEVEPLPVDSPLLAMPQVLLAPHNSNSSPAAWEKVHWNTIRNLLEGLELPTSDLGTFQKDRGS